MTTPAKGARGVGSRIRKLTDPLIRLAGGAITKKRMEVAGVVIIDQTVIDAIDTRMWAFRREALREINLDAQSLIYYARVLAYHKYRCLGIISEAEAIDLSQQAYGFLFEGKERKTELIPAKKINEKLKRKSGIAISIVDNLVALVETKTTNINRANELLAEARTRAEEMKEWLLADGVFCEPHLYAFIELLEKEIWELYSKWIDISVV